MRKSFFKRLVSAILAFSVIASVCACGGDSGGGKNKKKYDPNKTQIQVFVYLAGYGDDWLYSLENAFEKKYADRSFEDGKTGVQVWHTGDMKDFNATEIQQSKYDIFFLENGQYYSLLGDTLEDLTSIVTGTNTDGKTILSKLDDQQVDYFGVMQDGERHFYALPSDVGDYGLIYNVDLFESKGYYIADNKSGGFVIGDDKSARKSAGPDGEYDTDDDGLPATYDEFYELCDEIKNGNDIPLCWPGKYKEQHLGGLMNNLISNYEGVEQMRINYDFAGTANDLVVLDDEGKITYNADGSVKTESKKITTTNGYDVARQVGKLYGMEFIDEIMKADNGYYYKDSFTDSYSHTDNQEMFLMNGTEFSNESKTIAMLVDGVWWQEESKDVFESMASNDEKYSAKNRKFGWMPLPKANEEKIGSENVYTDFVDALMCLKKGAGTRKEAALEFIKFACTDEMLVDYTKITGAVRAYKYDIPDSALSDLTPFAKSMVNYAKKAKKVYKFSSSQFYNDNIGAFDDDALYSVYDDNGNIRKNVVSGIREGKLTGERFFEKNFAYFKNHSFWK